MDILPTTNASIRETYSRLDVKQTLQQDSGAASGAKDDSVLISQFLSYEQYTYSADFKADGSSALSPANIGAADQSGGADASSPQFGHTFLDIIQSRVKFLLDALAGNTDSSGSGLVAASPAASVLPEEGAVDSSHPSYYSAEQTASRIVGFALSFYDGGDRAEFASKVGDAVMKGYNQALEAMGGSLPNIAGNTISQVMDQLQQFASGTEINTVA